MGGDRPVQPGAVREGGSEEELRELMFQLRRESEEGQDEGHRP